MRRALWLRIGVLVFWLSWPALWVYLRRTERTRLLLMHQDSILVVRGWMSDGKWQLPGGGLHKGERPVIGLLRELREETGLEMMPKEVRVLATERYDSKGLQFTCRYFVARIDRPLHLNTHGMEIAAAEWLPRDAVTARRCGHDVLRALRLLDEKR